MNRSITLTGVLLGLVLISSSAHAEKPSAVGYRLAWRHERTALRLDPNDPLCSADVSEGGTEAERFMAALGRALEPIPRDIRDLPARDVDHPDVIAAIAYFEALAACREHVRASLAGELDEEPDVPTEEADDSEADDDGEADDSDILSEEIDEAPATEAGFVNALTPSARQHLAVLAAYEAGAVVASTLPADASELRRLRVVAEVAWPLCTGKFAALIMGGPPPGEREADADPWGWCRAAAQRLDRTRGMAEAMVARGLATLQTAQQALLGAAGEAEEQIEAAAARVEAEVEAAKSDVTEAKLAAESEVANAVLTIRDELAEVEAIADLVGLEATPAVDAALTKARGVYRRYEGALSKIVDKLSTKATDAVRSAAGKAGSEASKLLRKALQQTKKSVKKATRGK